MEIELLLLPKTHQHTPFTPASFYQPIHKAAQSCIHRRWSPSSILSHHTARKVAHLSTICTRAHFGRRFNQKLCTTVVESENLLRNLIIIISGYQTSFSYFLRPPSHHRTHTVISSESDFILLLLSFRSGMAGATAETINLIYLSSFDSTSSDSIFRLCFRHHHPSPMCISQCAFCMKIHQHHSIALNLPPKWCCDARYL